jgi:hypothetical protein
MSQASRADSRRVGSSDNVSESSNGALRSFIGWLDPQ